ncbi:TetR/AcrR family transcriptional regulator, partial [Microbacterium enclense]
GSLRRVRELWEDSLRPHTRNETALQMVLLVSDGLYFNAVLDLNALPGPTLEGADLDALISAVVAATT